MKKIFLLASVIAFCCHEKVTAQIKVDGTLSGSNVQGSSLTGSAASSIIVGNGNTTGGANTYIGNGTATTSSSATKNTFIGQGIAPNNTGNENTFVGEGVGILNNTGWANTFVGRYTGSKNDNGTANTFVGQFCGISNIAGNGNSFFGQGCAPNSNGGSNTFIGKAAAPDNTSGSANTFIGREAGKGNTDGYLNIAIGVGSGFSVGNLYNATAIGYNASVNANNAISLGAIGSNANAVKVGIGSENPIADLHIVKDETPSPSRFGVSILSHWNNNDNQSTLRLSSGIGLLQNDLVATIHSSGASGPITGAYGTSILPATTTPIVDEIKYNNLGLIGTRQSPLMIGAFPTTYTPSPNMPNYAQNIHFITGINTIPTGGLSTLVPWECMRINKSNGFVGIHTRSSTSSATLSSLGDPQAIFHVNLTNPIQTTYLNPFLQGIRFEGLPNYLPTMTPPVASHPDVLVVDADGNVARTPYSGGNSWLLRGNTIIPGDYIGTNNILDFVIKTNSKQRARVTVDATGAYGNFDFGTNGFFGATDNSGAFGELNNINDSKDAFASGKSNDITTTTSSNPSNYSVAFGESNLIQDARGSFVAGKSNSIKTNTSGKTGCIALGTDNEINNSDESVVLGELNTMHNGHGAFIAGGHNTSGNTSGGGQYNVLIGSHLKASPTASWTSPTAPIGNQIMIIGEQINSDLDQSLTIGFHANRTMVVNERGVNIQWNPTSFSTTSAIHNLDVEADPTGSSPLVGSNIAFHNLPSTSLKLPVIMVDGNGELFLSQNNYHNPLVVGDSGQSMRIQNLENALKIQEEQIAKQQKQIEELIATIKTNTFVGLKTKQSEVLAAIDLVLSNKDLIILSQNIPNPCDQLSTIGFNIPVNVQNALIRFTSIDGKVIQSLTIQERGKGVVNVYASELSAGTYLYSLYADGQLIDTKKMEISR